MSALGLGQVNEPALKEDFASLSRALLGGADKNPVGSRAVVGFGLRNANYEHNWRWRYKEEAASGSVENPEKWTKSPLLYVLWNLMTLVTHITICK